MKCFSQAAIQGSDDAQHILASEFTTQLED